MNAEKIQEIPELRFPKFIGEWPETEMGEWMTFKNGYNAGKEQYGMGKKFINVLDIIENDFITHERIVGLVNIPEKDFAKNEVEFGDLLFQRSSETREEVGQSNVYLDKYNSATFGGFVIRGKPKQEFDPIYYNGLLKSAKVRKDITSRSGGSTRYNIGQDSLAAVLINVAPTLPEQRKIANFLTAVDGRIQQLIQKKALLEDYKKGAMQQLFTQAIRFKDDHGNDFPEWEHAQLGAAVSSLDAGVSTNSEDTPVKKTELGILKTSCVSNGYFDASKNKRVIESEELIRLKEPVTKGSIIISRMNTPALVGLSGLVTESNPNLFLPDRLWAAKPVKGTSPEFTAQWLSTTKVRNLLSARATGTSGSMKNITKGDVLTLPIDLPVYEEQTKIANFLSAIDRKIENVATQITESQTFKRGLLQQMFV